MAQSTYNPYNAYRRIVGYKGDWHTAQQLGNDPSQYYRSAMPYYQELYDNGYGELAAELAKSDYTQAKGLRDKYGLKADDQFRVDQNYDAMNGSANGGAENGGAAANGANAAYSTGDGTVDKLLATGTGYNDAYDSLMQSAAGIASGQTAPAVSPEVQNLLDTWGSNSDRLNGEIRYDNNGNVISGLNTEHYNIGRNQLDYINNFDVTKQPYYEGIMAQYKLGGQNAADNAYASGAANNGGNIDSYAAANANRQQLAFTTAGQQAALAAAQQNADNWQTLYSQMSQDLTNQGTLNTQTLQAAANLYAVDAQERMNAMDTAGALQQQAMANSINAYLAKIADDTQRYGIDAQTAMNTENNRAAMEQLVAQLASQERMNTENNATTRYGYDTQERMNSENNVTQRYGYDTQLAGTRDTNAANRDIAGINANASLGVAGINADANKYSADQNYNLNKYLGELGYNQALAGYQNALDQVNAQIQGEKELAAANNAYTIKQANIDRNNQIRLLEAQYELAKKYGVTLDDSGNVSQDDTSDTNAADVFKYVTEAWNDYKGAQKYFKTIEEVYDAAAQYDFNHYGGKNKKVYTDYLNKMYTYANKNDNTWMGLLSGIMNTSDS